MKIRGHVSPTNIKKLFYVLKTTISKTADSLLFCNTKGKEACLSLFFKANACVCFGGTSASAFGMLRPTKSHREAIHKPPITQTPNTCNAFQWCSEEVIPMNCNALKGRVSDQWCVVSHPKDGSKFAIN